MEDKQYLNEERYQQTKKKITKAALIILIVGLIIGLGFIILGFITQNNNNTLYYDEFSAFKYIMFYVLGGITILISVFGSISIYLITKRREIAAFAIQQTMPLAQEGIEKMAPTIGNVAGTIGKDIAQGITSGIKSGLNNNDQK